MSDQPATPSASSIRAFKDRTFIPPATLAQSYRRNSRCPAKPSPTTKVAPGAFEISPNVFLGSDTAPPMHDPTESSVEDIALHLQENMQTPTRTPLAARRAAVNEELERYIDGYKTPTSFTPMNTPPSSASNARRGQTRTTSPDPRRSLSFEAFPRLSDSAKKLSSHPAYDVRPSVDRSILKMHFSYHSTPVQTSKQDFSSASDFYMDVDEDIDQAEANKENIDPAGSQIYDAQTHSSFETPPGAGRRSVVLTPIKSLFNQKKLAMIKTLGAMELCTPSSSEKAVAFNDENMSSDAFAIPSSDDMDISGDTTLAGAASSPFDSPTAVDIQTPTCSPTKQRNVCSYKFPQSQYSPGLKSKVGLITALGNHHKSPHPSPLYELDEQRLAKKNNIYEPSSPIPAPPTAQKLLHRNAKEREKKQARGTEILGLRSAERLRELRGRYPKNTRESGVRKRKGQSSLRRSLSAESDDEMDCNEMEMTKDVEYTESVLESQADWNLGAIGMVE
ncbi:hypothetical protein TWF696_001074 [Orbilia brochopaga]|uniref:Uncharacterized protein n=1 Tax=Orbilia brochopaga TaxID=3140254 RepID=A0AAV9VJK9_9PEZI